MNIHLYLHPFISIFMRIRDHQKEKLVKAKAIDLV